MKRSLFLLIALFLLLEISGQDILAIESDPVLKNLEEAKPGAWVRGKLSHFDPQSDNQVHISASVVQLSTIVNQNISPKIEADGSFSFQLSSYLPYQQVWFTISSGTKSYYLGELLIQDGLEIQADLEKLHDNPVRWFGEGISFSGLDAPITEFINQHVRFTNKQKQAIEKRKMAIRIKKDLSILDKVNQIKEVYKEIEILDEKFVETHPSPYAWILKNERLSEMYGFILVMYWMKEIDENVFQETLKHKPTLVTNSSTRYYGYLSELLRYPTPSTEVNMNKEILFSSVSTQKDKDSLELFWPVYELRLNRESHDLETYKWGAKKFLEPLQDKLEQARLNIQIDKIGKLSPHKRNLVAFRGQPDNLWEREKYLLAVLPLVSSSWYKDQMTSRLDKDSKRIEKLAIALDEENALNISHKLGTKVLELGRDAAFFIANHESVEVFLDSIKSAHPDTAIILDVWATWCGPCLIDMRRSKQVKKQLHELPVKVIYLCMASGRSNVKDWKKLIADMEVKGEHIFLQKDFYKEFMNYFELRAYPSFVFIDKEGSYDTKLISRISMLNIEKFKKKL